MSNFIFGIWYSWHQCQIKMALTWHQNPNSIKNFGIHGIKKANLALSGDPCSRGPFYRLEIKNKFEIPPE